MAFILPVQEDTRWAKEVKMTAKEVSAKDFDNNSIIDSEIVEEEDDPEDSNGTITEQVVNDTSQKLHGNTPTVTSELTENYSEEFETEEEPAEAVEESVVEYEDDYSEDVEEEEDITAPPKSMSDISASSSSSIRIRCEINISDSAVKSDQESVVVLPMTDDKRRSNVSSASQTTSQNNHRESSTRFTMDEEVRSWTPSDYNEESHLFDMGILHESMVNLLLLEDRKMQQERQRMRYKNGTRMSLSFTNERMREIERHNQILVRKIFQQSASPQVTVSTLI